MANSTARALVEPYMAFLPYIGLRLAVPLLAYFPLSLSFAMINLAFKLPLGTKYAPFPLLSRARADTSRRFGLGPGFIVSFFYIYIGMAALGLSLEAMITILSPRYTPLFLFVLVRLLFCCPHALMTTG